MVLDIKPTNNTIAHQIVHSSSILMSSNISTARLDTFVFMETITKKDRAWLLVHDDEVLTMEQVAKLEELVLKRQKHIPVAYLVGNKEFYGRSFTVNPHVLVPRPETEVMIDLLKEIENTRRLNQENDSLKHTTRIADIGCGCGAIGITAFLEIPNCTVELIDIEEQALNVAKTNVDLFTIKISTTKGDLLSDTTNTYDIVLCNLPYVPNDYPIDQSVLHEPSVAIYGGSDGLDLYRKVFKQASSLKNKPLYFYTESMPTQHKELTNIAERANYRCIKSKDFIQVFTIKNSN